MADESNIVVMTDEDGKDVRMEYLATIDHDEKEYAILLPEGDTEGMVVIMLVEDDPNDEEGLLFKAEEDEATLNAVFEQFKEAHKEEFDFDN